MADFFVHEQGLVDDGAEVGEGTTIWAFAHVLPGARVGAQVNVCDGVFIEGGAVVGDRVTLKCGVQVWDGVTLEEDVFVGPNATFTNDAYPRSKQHLDEHPQTLVRAGASLGANCTLLPGIVVGREAMVGAGAVVTRNVPDFAVVAGNPARIMGYAASQVETPPAVELTPGATGPTATGVEGATLYRLPSHTDMRGSLVVGELPDTLPFAAHRWFIVHDVPSTEVRGEHAHHHCHQFLVCVGGSVRVMADDGRSRAAVLLDRPDVGLHLAPMTWGVQYDYSADANLLVLASKSYDSDDYIRSHREFQGLVRRQRERPDG